MTSLNALFGEYDYTKKREVLDVTWQKNNKKYFAKQMTLAPVKFKEVTGNRGEIATHISGQLLMKHFSSQLTSERYQEIIISFTVLQDIAAVIELRINDRRRIRHEKHTLDFNKESGDWVLRQNNGKAGYPVADPGFYQVLSWILGL